VLLDRCLFENIKLQQHIDTLCIACSLQLLVDCCAAMTDISALTSVLQAVSRHQMLSRASESSFIALCWPHCHSLASWPDYGTLSCYPHAECDSDDCVMQLCTSFSYSDFNSCTLSSSPLQLTCLSSIAVARCTRCSYTGLRRVATLTRSSWRLKC
jgi:hypothetical protein